MSEADERPRVEPENVVPSDLSDDPQGAVEDVNDALGVLEETLKGLPHGNDQSKAALRSSYENVLVARQTIRKYAELNEDLEVFDR